MSNPFIVDDPYADEEGEETTPPQAPAASDAIKALHAAAAAAVAPAAPNASKHAFAAPPNPPPEDSIAALAAGLAQAGISNVQSQGKSQSQSHGVLVNDEFGDDDFAMPSTRPAATSSASDDDRNIDEIEQYMLGHIPDHQTDAAIAQLQRELSDELEMEAQLDRAIMEKSAMHGATFRPGQGAEAGAAAGGHGKYGYQQQPQFAPEDTAAAEDYWYAECADCQCCTGFKYRCGCVEGGYAACTTCAHDENYEAGIVSYEEYCVWMHEQQQVDGVGQQGQYGQPYYYPSGGASSNAQRQPRLQGQGSSGGSSMKPTAPAFVPGGQRGNTSTSTNSSSTSSSTSTGAAASGSSMRTSATAFVPNYGAAAFTPAGLGQQQGQQGQQGAGSHR